MKIEITENPKEEDSKRISKGIIDFNKSKVPNLETIEDEVKFFVFVKDEKGDILGGIRALCFWNTLHIELLWLSEGARGKGIGKKLIKSAENFAIKNNCEKVFVETTSWQAKPFYEKVGYRLMASIKDRPKGYTSHYLTKELKVNVF